jgi:carboxyl-terminal processing protease
MKPNIAHAARQVLCLAMLVVGVIASEGCAAKSKSAPERAPIVAMTAAQRQANIDSFDQVWTTIRDKHYDPTLGGLDWQAVHDELRPRVERAASTDQARAVMTEMISRLGQSHFAIIPASVYTVVADTEPGSNGPGSNSGADANVAKTGDEDVDAEGDDGVADGEGVLGLDIRIVNNEAMITKVREGSPAAECGVKTGWIIRKAGETDIPKLIDRVSTSMSTAKLRQLLLTRAIESRLMGNVGERVTLKCRDGRNKTVTRTVTFAEPPGEETTFGNLPATRVEMEARRVGDGRVGYIAFSIFLDPPRLMKFFNEWIKSFMDADGVIIDLRGNPGGIGAMAMGMGGWFVDRSDQKLGTMITRESKLNFVLNPRAQTFAGPVAILVDELSLSTSEILAGGLRDIGRAKVFGTPTGGAALPSTIERLANGDGFQYAFANYISAGGQPLEGIGVIPDVEVNLDRASLLEGHDPVIDAAVKWILEQPKP